MADKISTIVLKVDLECERCYRKIRKVLCKIQDKMNIKTISFDEKSNTVTISGPFDADMVGNKLCCKAGRVIKEMDVKGKGKDAGKAKDGGGDKAKDAAKPAGEKDAGKAKEGGAKAEKKEEKAEKKEGGKGDKQEAKPDKAEKKEGGKDGKADAKKVKFDLDGGAPAPAADAKPGKAMVMPPGMTKADLGPLLEKMMAAKAGSDPPRRAWPCRPSGPRPPGPSPATATTQATTTALALAGTATATAAAAAGTTATAGAASRPRPAATTASPCTTARGGTTAAAAAPGSRTTPSSSSSTTARTPMPGAASCDGDARRQPVDGWRDRSNQCVVTHTTMVSAAVLPCRSGREKKTLLFFFSVCPLVLVYACGFC